MLLRLLKDVDQYNMSGFDKNLLSEKKGHVFEVEPVRAGMLIENGLAEKVSKEKVEDAKDDQGIEIHLSVAEEIAKLSKSKIEDIMRLYDIDVDKRQSRAVLLEDLVLTVGTELPRSVNAGESVLEELVTFYHAAFKIKLRPEMSEGKGWEGLAEVMSSVIARILKTEEDDDA